MFRKLFIYLFNKKYAGKELYFCEKIYSDICFYPTVVLQCCFSTKMPYSPPLLFRHPNIINIKDYIKKIDRLMELNQSNVGPCQGCKFLTKQVIPKMPYKENIKFLTINHFSKCNSNCVYCGIGNKTLDVNYKLLPIVSNMNKQKMLHKECLINWGGGEPTLCSDFEELASFFSKNKIRQAINSSGIIFSETIMNGLKDGSISVQISPDSGTEETYYKIKRQNNFNKVWENISKYAEAPDMLFVKYIFFSMSANENDVREFINKCLKSGVKNIVIDCESNTANNPHSRFGNVTQEILELAKLMKNLAIENNINFQVSYQWKDEHKKYIEEN